MIPVPNVLLLKWDNSPHLCIKTEMKVCLSAVTTTCVCVCYSVFFFFPRDLSNNQISEIAPDAFHGLRALNSL